VQHLKELKIENYNEDRFERAIFQCDDVLECLKATYGHTRRKVDFFDWSL